jgi:hypothetical protein
VYCTAKNEEYFCDMIISCMETIEVADYSLRPWQQALHDKLEGPLNDREVIDVIDKVGMQAKVTSLTGMPPNIHKRSLPGKINGMTFHTKR